MHWLGPVQSLPWFQQYKLLQAVLGLQYSLYCWQTVHKYCHFHCLQIQSWCSGSICAEDQYSFPWTLNCGKVHSILDSLWWAWQPRFPNPSDPLRTSVSQDSCRSVVAKLSQQLLGPNSFSGQRRPGHACTKELREEHWHQREYPRNLAETGSGPPSTAIPDASWNLRHTVVTLFTTPRESAEALQEFYRLSINLCKMCMYTSSWGGLPQWKCRVLTTGPPGNSLSYIYIFF